MFAHPLMLAWGAAAAVPLFLRLLGRAVDRTVDFSAMLFLPGGAAAASGGGRWRDWLLLLVRSAALGTLAVALARPILPAAWSTVPTAGLVAGDRATVALVIDDSAGMGYTRGGTSRFDVATRIGLGVLAGLGRGDRAAVVADPPPVGWVDLRPSGDLAAAANAVSGLRPTRRSGDLADALSRAADLLADVTGPRQVVVVCDRESVAWRNVTDAFGRLWQHGKDGRGPPRVIVVPVGADEADNVAVTSVRAVDGPMVRDLPGTVRVTVRNWGPEPRANVPVSVWTGPRQLADAVVSLPPRGTGTVDVPVRFAEEGSKLISAAVRTSGLSFDDRRDGVADVVAPARVLLVTDDAAAAAPLRVAMAPGGSGNPAVVTVVAGGGWAGVDRAQYDVVVLADVGEVTMERADELRRFVDDGGGLLVAPGRHVSAGDYNDELGEDGVDLLPAVLRESRPTNGNLRLLDVDHPIVSFVGGGDLRNGPRIGRMFDLGGRPAGRVLATLDNHPAIVATEVPDGGRVVLSTVALDDSAGPMTRADLFLPLVQSTVRWLAEGAGDDHEAPAGRPIVVRVDPAVDDRSATAQLMPAGRREPARIVRVGGRAELRFERTAASGTYRLRYRVGGQERTAYGVATPPAEASDLSALSANAWRAMGRRIGFERVDPTPAAVLAAVARGRGGPEGWAMGVGGVLALLVGETLLGRRWSGGAERRVESPVR